MPKPPILSILTVIPPPRCFFRRIQKMGVGMISLKSVVRRSRKRTRLLWIWISYCKTKGYQISWPQTRRRYCGNWRLKLEGMGWLTTLCSLKFMWSSRATSYRWSLLRKWATRIMRTRWTNTSMKKLSGVSLFIARKIDCPIVSNKSFIRLY